MASNTSDEPVAVDPTRAADERAIEKEMAEAGVNDVPLESDLTEILTGDHKDVMLLGYMTAIIRLFDGANGEGNPGICSTVEEVVDWISFAVVVIIFTVRHFILIPKGKVWHRVLRGLLFTSFALCVHSQPISCSLPRTTTTVNGTSTVKVMGLSTLHYVQGAVMLTLAIIATEFFRQTVTRDHAAAKKAASDKQETIPLTELPHSGPPANLDD
eukprot:scpid85680/ scgid21895/ 